MGERRGNLPGLVHRSRKSEQPVTPKVLSPRLSPKGRHFPTVDGATLSRLHSPVGRLSTEERKGGYRSPTIRLKQDLLARLKELRTCGDPPGIKAAHNLYSVMSILSQEPGYYREEMQLVCRALQKVLYCPKAAIPDHIWHFIYARDVEMILEPEGQVPYCHLAGFLVAYAESVLGKERNTKELVRTTEERLEDVIKAKEQEIAEFRKQLEAMTGSQQPLAKELVRAAEDMEKMQEEAKIYQTRLRKMEDKYEAVKVTLRDDMRLIADLDKKVKMLNQTALEASNALETLEIAHQSLIQDHEALIDNHQHSLTCINQLTKRCETLQEDKRKLEEEIYRLQVRAAAGFEELTPRPSFAVIYEALGTDPPAVTRTEEQIKALEKLVKTIQRKTSRPRFTRKAPSPDSRDSTPKS